MFHLNNYRLQNLLLESTVSQRVYDSRLREESLEIFDLMNFNCVQIGTKMTDAHRSPSSSNIATYFTVF